MASQKCPICGKKYDERDSLALHIESKHANEIPQNWSGLKYIFYSKHGRTNGTCMVCKGKTDFNEKTGKPARICNNPLCVKKLRENAVNNNIKKFGKATLLNDPEFQIKMLNNRKISKDYKWSDGKSVKRVVGSFEYDGMEKLDLFFNFDSADVIVPAPFVIPYEYEGETHFYIPDAYITSLNLLIEFKDGGSNPNTHHKIQAVDKVKEKLKEEAVKKMGKYNYVKVVNKEYDTLMKALIELKNKEDLDNDKGKMTPVFISESSNLLSESSEDGYEQIYDEIGIVTFTEKGTSFLVEIGIKTKDKIYAFRSENVMIIDLADITIESRMRIHIRKDYLEILSDYVQALANETLPDYISPVNFPMYVIYDLTLREETKQGIYDKDSLSLDDVVTTVSIDDYLKYPLVFEVINSENEELKESTIIGLIENVDNEVDELVEKMISSKQRNDLNDKQFGIPEERKYPLTDKRHVSSAVTYFNKCETKYRKELADNINKRAKQLNMKISVSKDNPFYDYADKDILKEQFLSIPAECMEYQLNEMYETEVSFQNKKIMKLVQDASDKFLLKLASFKVSRIKDSKDKQLMENIIENKKINLGVLNKDIDLILNAIEDNNIHLLNNLDETDTQIVNNILKVYDKYDLNTNNIHWV